jgi:outer membrane immunogenic protein
MFNPFKKARPRSHPFVLAAYLLAATMPFACGSQIAAAADMSMPMKAAPASVYQWSGCYAGLNGGGGAISSDFTATVSPGSYLGAADSATVSNDGTGSANNTNFLGGGQAGCNWQSGTVVVGIEGDFDYFHSTSAFFNNTDTLPALGVPFVAGESVTTNYLATVRPRIGIAADRNFAYVTGGVAFTKANYTESYSDGSAPPGTGTAIDSKFLTGWTAGAGWEYALTDHWLVRFEYLFAAFPKTSAVGVITEPGVGTNAMQGSANLVLQVARAGMNFKF